MFFKKIIFSFFLLLISLILYTISSLGVPGYLPTDSEFSFLSNHTYSQWLAPSSSKLAYQVYLPNHFTLLVSSSGNFSCLASLCNPLKPNLSCYSETSLVPFELISHWVPHVIFLLGLFCVTVSHITFVLISGMPMSFLNFLKLLISWVQCKSPLLQKLFPFHLSSHWNTLSLITYIYLMFPNRLSSLSRALTFYTLSLFISLLIFLLPTVYNCTDSKCCILYKM